MIGAVFEILLHGLTLGGLYGLIGAGLALNFGVLRVVNLAHGEMITLGAFITVGSLALVPGLPLWLVLPIAGLGCAAIGAGLQVVFIERAMSFRDPMVPLLVTFGIAIIMRNLLVETLGADLRGLDVQGLGQARFALFGLSIGLLPVLTLALALIAFGILAFVIAKTEFGRQVRAVSDLPDIAALMSIRVKKIHIQVAALSAGLAALAGVLLAMRASVSPFSGVAHLIIAFEVVVLGGLGSMRGALIAGVVLGLVQVVSTRIDGNAGLLYVHIFFFAGLLIRSALGRLS
ncbi:branched-chain amino acid ABC transporter permease [Pelagibacterium halotolerans]|uniref:branched-chain amino acid ABC transporter permease n=1 Tax=Pelagibacterium halotolerans TaxID=531813 RepID=UPI00385011EB